MVASTDDRQLIAGSEPHGLNGQHANLAIDAGAPEPRVGDRVALGISHPCTTFDKWRWMALVDDGYDVLGAIVTRF